MLRFRAPYAEDFDFEAAVVGVVIFANAIGEIDEAALIEAKLRWRARRGSSRRRGWNATVLHWSEWR